MLVTMTFIYLLRMFDESNSLDLLLVIKNEESNSLIKLIFRKFEFVYFMNIIKRLIII